jgi:8-oxo-dGTP pyrophosphatase MutT (NUDIX family)
VSPRPAWLEPLVDALNDPHRLSRSVALRPGVGARAAGVLILVGEQLGQPDIVFVERAATLRKHAGQIAFPGGAADPDDPDLAATALREAEEEIGLDPHGVEVLGALPPAHVAVSGFDVTAVVGWWAQRSPVSPRDLREVASVVEVPVAHLVDPARRARVRHPSGYTGPAFEIDAHESPGEGPHLLEVPAGQRMAAHRHRHLIWGLTAHLLDAFLDLAGWQRPWNTDRLLDIPTRYLRDRRPDLGGPDAH